MDKPVTPRGINHLALNIRDMEESHCFWTEIVGLLALDGVVERLKRGARVADIGCGHRASTIVMAQAFPKSHFIGLDYHDASIATARKRAASRA
jgi:tRNA G46 methylase TrmB